LDYVYHLQAWAVCIMAATGINYTWLTNKAAVATVKQQ